MPHYYAADLWSKVDIQHFNVSSCQQLASSILCLTTMQLIFGPKVDIQHFNVSLANNWPPLNTMHLILCSWSLVQGGYSTFNVSSCQQLASSVLCTSLLYCHLLVQVDIQHFNVSSCQQLASLILCLTTMQLIFGQKWIFNILMCPLANNWPPQYYAPHYYATDLWSKVDIQHFNVSSCQQLASSILCTSLLCSWSLVQGGYSTF
jgi:hypothetical protein